ncbi:MAG: hypothetical protein PUC98_08360 [Clostridiales bacterium]|nr:hypothetical protein [Clostridiales bacterium]
MKNHSEIKKITTSAGQILCFIQLLLFFVPVFEMRIKAMLFGTSASEQIKFSLFDVFRGKEIEVMGYATRTDPAPAALCFLILTVITLVMFRMSAKSEKFAVGAIAGELAFGGLLMLVNQSIIQAEASENYILASASLKVGTTAGYKVMIVTVIALIALSVVTMLQKSMKLSDMSGMAEKAEQAGRVFGSAISDVSKAVSNVASKAASRINPDFRRCSHCGARLDEDDLFCSCCGRRVTAGTSANDTVEASTETSEEIPAEEQTGASAGAAQECDGVGQE